MKRRSRGVSLIELMIALAIGTVLVAGAVTVYSQSRTTHTVSDSIARLQENGRYVFSQIEPDIQLAGYYGFTNAPDDLHYMQNGSSGAVLSAFRMQKTSDEVPGLGKAQDCGKNFAVDVVATIEAANNDYKLGCDAQGGGAQDKSDRLTIRRASGPPPNGKGAANDKRVQLLLSRLSPTSQYVFADGMLPASITLKANLVQVRDLVVRSYYISKNSTSSPAVDGLPALRVKALTDGPSFDSDTEIMRGVEDMQVQFGIDTADYDADGKIDSGRDVDNNGIPDVALGIATRYVNPDAVPAGFQVVSVRIWILMRAEKAEPGFVNNQTYQYADRVYEVNDSFRRVLLSRTITLRNSRTL
jgi:type IV pilus assembly protein PilW